MNALTFAHKDDIGHLSIGVSRAKPELVDAPTRLRPVKGIILGVALAVAFWAVVGFVVVTLVHG